MTRNSLKIFFFIISDEDSRKNVFEAALRKSPVNMDVDLSVLSRYTNGFSGTVAFMLTPLITPSCRSYTSYIINI